MARNKTLITANKAKEDEFYTQMVKLVSNFKNLQKPMHIGKRIKEILDSQPKNHTVSWFARQLNCDRRNVYNIFTREYIDTMQLARISIILNHNFFTDLANSLELGDYDDINKPKA